MAFVNWIFQRRVTRNYTTTTLAIHILLNNVIKQCLVELVIITHIHTPWVFGPILVFLACVCVFANVFAKCDHVFDDKLNSN